MSNCACLCGLSSCTSEAISPQIDYTIQDKYIQQLDPLFSPLLPEEAQTSWGIEYAIGLQFAKQLDLYQAVTAFKRAQILVPEENFVRNGELQYYIIKCYYLGKRYEEVIDFFESSAFASFPQNFPGHQDFLVMLFESYLRCDQMDQTAQIIRYMQKINPLRSEELDTCDAIVRADFAKLENLQKISTIHNADVQAATTDVLTNYYKFRKSPTQAALYNTFLPGAGYFYLGQTQAACTALCLNGLFIAAAAHFFHTGNIPAGIITVGFELGWYIGGIYGVQQSAKLYNERLFEKNAHFHLREQKLFPLLMLQHGF